MSLNNHTFLYIFMYTGMRTGAHVNKCHMHPCTYIDKQQPIHTPYILKHRHVHLYTYAYTEKHKYIIACAHIDILMHM